MRAVFLSGVLGFVAVLVIAFALRSPGPVESTPTPAVSGPAIRCLPDIDDATCQKLASESIARAQANNPGRIPATVTIRSFGEFEVCFTDGSCYGESQPVPVGPGDGAIPPVTEAPTSEPAPGNAVPR